MRGATALLLETGREQEKGRPKRNYPSPRKRPLGGKPKKKKKWGVPRREDQMVREAPRTLLPVEWLISAGRRKNRRYREVGERVGIQGPRLQETGGGGVVLGTRSARENGRVKVPRRKRKRTNRPRAFQHAGSGRNARNTGPLEQVGNTPRCLAVWEGGGLRGSNGRPGFSNKEGIMGRKAGRSDLLLTDFHRM